jgi:tRNA(adenine34) deaminase
VGVSVIDVRAEDTRFMMAALELAEAAAELGEAPVGALVVIAGRVVGRGHNRIELDRDPTAHAEVLALRQATRAIGDWRLPHACLYVTLEPCLMCAAALIHARMARVVFGARDDRWGGMGSLFDLAHDPRLNHEIEVIPGVLGQEAKILMQQFFANVRKRPQRT